MTWERGDWMVTASGVHAYPADPQRTDIRIQDIAHALARICRFGGHVRVPHYSVAQHSVLVSRLVPPPMALVGLLHDAAETYTGDVVKPFKRSLYVRAYDECIVTLSELEHQWWIAIADTFNLPHEMPHEVKDADLCALWTERRDVMAANSSVPSGTPLDVRIVALDSVDAEYEFIERYLELTTP